jgi:hypothetical protein
VATAPTAEAPAGSDGADSSDAAGGSETAVGEGS